MLLKNNTFSYKIYYEDTDAGGVVYYANYLRFLERARTDFLEKGGISAKLLHSQGSFLAVKSVKAEYIKPVFYGDIITVHIFIKNFKKASFNVCYEIYKEQLIVFTGETILVSIDKNFKVNRLPDKIINFLQKYSTCKN